MCPPHSLRGSARLRHAIVVVVVVRWGGGRQNKGSATLWNPDTPAGSLFFLLCSHFEGILLR